MDLLEILQVYRIRQHNTTCVQTPLPWQLKREQWPFVEKTSFDDFSIRGNTIYQLGYN